MPSNYDIADHSTLRSDWGAKPQQYRMVTNSTVIRLERATHRGCEPFAGTFELVAPSNDPRQFQGKLSVEVYCAWHGRKPLTCFPHIHILGKYEVLDGYTGEVVDNIA